MGKLIKQLSKHDSPGELRGTYTYCMWVKWFKVSLLLVVLYV